HIHEAWAHMKRGHYKTEAVVLNAFDYGESDVIVSLCTRDFGKIKGIAKGGRRSKKRFVATLSPLARIDLHFHHSERSDLNRLEDSKLIDGFNALKTDIERVSIGSYFLELTDEMTREGEPAPELFELLTGFLRMIENTEKPANVARFFEIRMLSLLGFMPVLDGCVVCNKSSNGERGYFNSERGGLVCKACAVGVRNLIPISMGTAGFLSTASKFSIEKLSRLQPSDSLVSEGERVLGDFIRHQTGKELKTKRFMESLKAAF
ncbi:MAG: DNA repair protein RecO, partial [Thermodesulfobacteriota bacterium]